VRAVVIIIFACSPNGECREHRVEAEEPAIASPCMSSSLGVVQEWQSRHSGYIVDHWRCEEDKKS
jgi:hypothetical protein